MCCQDWALASPEHKLLLEPFPLLLVLLVLLGALHPPALCYSAVFSSSKPYREGLCRLPISAENTAPCLPELGFCPGATTQTTACGATGVKHCLSSLSRDPVLQIWSRMGNKCSSNWQKRCYPVVLRRWETCLHWAYRFWATPLVHPHKNVCPTSLGSPVGSLFGILHKAVWWRLIGYIWLAHISKTGQRTSLFVSVPSICLTRGWLTKKGSLPCSKMGKIVCVQLENGVVSQQLFSLSTKKVRMAGVETECVRCSFILSEI